MPFGNDVKLNDCHGTNWKYVSPDPESRTSRTVNGRAIP
jgi:hypothetical protein